ncbi:Crp/Fnr family transcriptional regulator [Desertibacillus haloalkaliphilus]|uniref:Crp/Fnr family transcriptional regulator n=1 Tax=Desertibacillus haloalkaliphilus TaxID=1328930 RepID=UPI001C277F7D|nr:Crp/Fnr family transcriptional regulator [Desertibacillus haloalkaliphilus]MBU8908338.1 Crp/Fnr family transcriptional regulator [Desertibacillus haloalkaliphilus]
MTVKEFVNHIPLFSELPKHQKEHLHKIIMHRTIKKGEVIFHEHEIAEAVFFVNEGKVRISKGTPDGKEIVLTIRQPGEIFAEVSLFTQPGNTYPATATAIENGVVSYILVSEIENFLKDHPELSLAIFRIMSERLRISQSTLRDVALYGKLESLAATLLRLSDEYGVETSTGLKINLKLTHEELGSFFGATRESVNRLINKLKRHHVLSMQQGYITIHSIEELKDYIS